MEELYPPSEYNASEHINLSEFLQSLTEFTFGNEAFLISEERCLDLVLQKLNLDGRFDCNRLKADCSPDLLKTETEVIGEKVKKKLDTLHVREKYKKLITDVFDSDGSEEENNREQSESIVFDLVPGRDFLVSIRFYFPLSRKQATDTGSDIRNRALDLKFSHELTVLGSNTLAELRDKILCVYDKVLCIDISSNIDGKDHLNPKEDYPSGFFFIDGTFYNDFRHPNSIDYSEVIRKWTDQENIGPLNASCMSTTSINQLKPRFGYPYVYRHQGDCEHIFVFSDIWILSVRDSLDSKQYPMCTAMHVQKCEQSCYSCASAPAKWACTESNRLPHAIHLFCDICFRSYNYIDGVKVGNFRAYPYVNPKQLKAKDEYFDESCGSEIQEIDD